jgi:regulator of nucleoside diphosphate kinase
VNFRTITLILSSKKNIPNILKLREELDRAVVLNPEALPDQVVSLNSKVSLRDLKTNQIENWVLTMPEHADPDQQRISVLAPIGTAVLGYSEGHDIEWETPGGVRVLNIESVEQNAFVPTRQVHALYA